MLHEHAAIGVVGASGYGGAELLRLLGSHPTLKLRTVAAGSAAGRRVEEVFPHLGEDLGVGPLVPAAAEHLDGCDLVLLATPHEVSLRLAPALLDGGQGVVDLSGAFRLPADAFATWYGVPHTAPELAPAVYGLPELWRDRVGGARLVANPGCYPTAALLALAPLAGLVDPDRVVVTGLSGTSGAGKGLRDDLHASHVIGNVAPYGAPRHRHTAEIAGGWRELAGGGGTVSFTPHLVPVARGLVCTVVAELAAGVAEADVRGAYEAAWGGEPFVRLLPPGAWPQTAHTLGANSAHVGVAVDPAAGRVTAACAIDNLVKGAAGQALQNANLLCGLPETAGLPTAAVYP